MLNCLAKKYFKKKFRKLIFVLTKGLYLCNKTNKTKQNATN